jgi:hypothetical protein
LKSLNLTMLQTKGYDYKFESPFDVFQVGKILPDFPGKENTTDDSTESTDDKKSDNVNDENKTSTEAEESVESLDVAPDEKVTSDSSSVEMVTVDPDPSKEEIETDIPELEDTVKSEVNGDVNSDFKSENELEDVDPLSSADSQVLIQPLSCPSLLISSTL